MRLREEIIACAGKVANFSGRRKPGNPSPAFLHEEKEKLLPFTICADGFPEGSFRHRPARQDTRPFGQGLQQVEGRRDVAGRGGRKYEP
jgi:hypothetical protein